MCRWMVLLMSLVVLTSLQADDWTGKTIKVKENGLKLGRKLGGGLVRDGEALDSSKTYRVKASDDTYLELEGGFIFRIDAEAVADATPFPKPLKDGEKVKTDGWFGKKVLPKRSEDTIQIGDWVDGKQETWTPHNLLNSTVREDRGGFLRVYDGRREGWVSKDDMVTAEDAPAYFDKAVKENPNSYHGWDMRGISWYRKGEFDNAIKDFTEAIRLEPDSSPSYNNRGNVWHAKKEYDKAITDYTESLKLNPNSASSYNNRGNAWYGKKEYDKAIADYTEAIRLNPSSASSHSNRGNAWKDKKEYDKAIADYTEALKLDPKFVNGYNGRGNAWYGKKEYDKAITDYDEALKLDPKYVHAYNGRGNAWKAKKEYDKASTDYDEALKLDPKYVFAYSGRGNAWKDKKEYDKAIADYTEALKLDPNDAYAHGNRAITYTKLKKYDEAAAGFEKAIELDPMDWIHRNYAKFRANCPEAKYRDGKKAVELAKKAVEKAGKDTDWQYADALAMAYAEASDFELAVAEQRKAIEMLKAEKAPDVEDLKQAEARLELYRAKKPYRDE
ncbi:MAG: tetratricopeptide repeat protein [Fimbriiglobus sp.]